VTDSFIDSLKVTEMVALAAIRVAPFDGVTDVTVGEVSSTEGLPSFEQPKIRLITKIADTSRNSFFINY
jgi:hypothetical protein